MFFTLKLAAEEGVVVGNYLRLRLGGCQELVLTPILLKR